MPAASGVAGKERADDGGEDTGKILGSGDDTRRSQLCQEIVAQPPVDLFRREAVNDERGRALALAQQEVRRLPQRVARLSHQRAKSLHVNATGIDADKWAAGESAFLIAHPPCSVVRSQSLLPVLASALFQNSLFCVMYNKVTVPTTIKRRNSL